MLDARQVDAQLKRLGVKVNKWGAAEARELPRILMGHEQITAYIHGWYENGFATLVATTERLLLIDKKAFNLTIEDVRYDMIAEVDYNARLLDATIRINTLNKTLRFTSMRQARLRHLITYVQQRVMDLRQQQFTWQQFEQTPMSLPQAPLVPQPAAASMPLQAPQLSPMRRLTNANPYTKGSLTSNQHNFLPRVPRRFRPR